MATVTTAYTVTPAPFPTRTRMASATLHGIDTTVTSVDFADKILVTITQNGRLAHWVSTVRVHGIEVLTVYSSMCHLTSRQPTCP